MKQSLPHIGVIGGDVRQFYMAEGLIEKGFPVTIYAVPIPKEASLHCIPKAPSLKELFDSSSILICPTPFTKDNQHIFTAIPDIQISISEFFPSLSKRYTVFAGSIPASLQSALKKADIRVYDFSLLESVAHLNSIATAEGAIAEALLHKNTILSGSSCLVLGYGKCGMTLADRLSGMKAKVSICDLSDTAMSRAEAFGFLTLPFSQIEKRLSSFSYIFNTVPACILGKKELECTAPDVLIVDIASAPGGLDYHAAKILSRHTIHALALPGRYAPASSGRFLADYIAAQIKDDRKE